MAIGKKEAKLLTALIDQLVPQDFGQSYGAAVKQARCYLERFESKMKR